jgi:chromosome segregation ATPase
MGQNKSAATNGQQSIEELQDRYVKLNHKKIAAETELKGAEKRLKELQKEAHEKYGTDDVAALRKMLDDLKAENESKRAGYQAELDRIESELSAVEAKFSDSQAPAPGGSGK